MSVCFSSSNSIVIILYADPSFSFKCDSRFNQFIRKRIVVNLEAKVFKLDQRVLSATAATSSPLREVLIRPRLGLGPDMPFHLLFFFFWPF